MNRRRLLAACLIATAVAAVLWLFLRPRPLAVDLLELRAVDVQTSVVASGRVLPPARVEAGATLTGRVERVPVREGARVKAGEVLVELERTELAAAVAQAQAAVARARARVASVRTLALPTAQAGLRQAEANLLLAEQEERRNRELLAKGFISQARLDEVLRQLEVARSAQASARANAGAQATEGAEAQQALGQLAEAEAALATAEARLAQTRIRAPGDGVVLERLIEPGDILQPGRRTISLALDGPLRLVVQVDEKNLPLIRPGAVAVAAADAFPAERFEAVVSYISAGVDPARGSVELRLDVAKPPPALRADMTVSIDLAGPLLPQALMLPADAVRQLQTEAPWVLVERGGRAVRSAVKPGLQTQGRVAIAEGLKAGDRVVLSREAEDGMHIRARR